ncbi:MAG TPA: His/Gly/Thr/Pro-type tRNA ligase C-terminal domain-containing protein, partial [Acidimicrobiales bacterium]|nr:His/Gly/Thr/Pro-type tRNA ligase C-terminal domain-containing protein [Acidimicrobiales bacterium]
LRAGQARVEVDSADEPLNARIRRWKLEKVPYLLVVGDDDVAARTVGVNPRSSQDPVRGVPLDTFRAALSAEIAAKGSPEKGGEPDG